MIDQMPYAGPLLVTDPDYPTKQNAILRYLVGLMLAKARGADMSGSNGVATGQVAQYGMDGTRLAIMSDGLPAAAVKTDAVTEPKNLTAGIQNVDLVPGSIQRFQGGAVGIPIVAFSADVSVTAVTTEFTVVFDESSLFPIAERGYAPVLFASVLESGAPSDHWSLRIKSIDNAEAVLVIYAEDSLTAAEWTVNGIIVGV